MTAVPLYPRFVASRVREALADSPAVFLLGPRQSGKTTLVQGIGREARYPYFTFDDAVVAGAAQSDPVGFIDDLSPRAIVDEVQKVPAVFSALKASIDRDRSAGRFLLTGSLNVLALPAISDSLAGRMATVRLLPLAQCELAGRPSDFLRRLFQGAFRARPYERLGKELAQRVCAGGFPAALARSQARRRAAWYRDYIEALVQRDVRDIARVTALDALPRLLTLIAGQTARLLNISDLASPFQLTRPTIREYTIHLQRMFLIDELPPWHSNRMSRLVKTPKIHMSDTGVACALLGLDPDGLLADRALLGHLLETFVFNDLSRQAGWQDEPLRFSHFRDRDGFEVDIVVERGSGQLAGIEVKASASVGTEDFRGLQKLKSAAGRRFVAGAVVYDGSASVRFAEGLYALPVRALWESLS